MVFLELLLIPSPNDNTIIDSAEGVLVSHRVICHTRGFYQTTSTIHQNNGKFCSWGVTINPATKLQCKYKHYSIRRPGSRWSNSGNNKILSFNCQTCIHNKRNLNFGNSNISNRINNFFMWNKALVIPRILLDPCSLSSLL